MKNYTKIFCFFGISYKTLIGAKPFRIRFDKVDGFTRVYDGSIYLVFFSSEKYESIPNRIRYLISQKRGTTYTISDNYANIKLESYNFLSLEKILTFHIIIILLKSVFNENKNNYYYNIFLEKCSFN